MSKSLSWEQQDYYADGYDFSKDLGYLPTHDMSDYPADCVKPYMDGAKEAMIVRRENRGIPAMTSAEMHEFEFC